MRRWIRNSPRPCETSGSGTASTSIGAGRSRSHGRGSRRPRGPPHLGAHVDAAGRVAAVHEGVDEGLVGGEQDLARGLGRHAVRRPGRRSSFACAWPRTRERQAQAQGVAPRLVVSVHGCAEPSRPRFASCLSLSGAVRPSAPFGPRPASVAPRPGRSLSGLIGRPQRPPSPGGYNPCEAKAPRHRRGYPVPPGKSMGEQRALWRHDVLSRSHGAIGPETRHEDQSGDAERPPPNTAWSLPEGAWRAPDPASDRRDVTPAAGDPTRPCPCERAARAERPPDWRPSGATATGWGTDVAGGGWTSAAGRAAPAGAPAPARRQAPVPGPRPPGRARGRGIGAAVSRRRHQPGLLAVRHLDVGPHARVQPRERARGTNGSSRSTSSRRRVGRARAPRRSPRASTAPSSTST